MKRFIFVFLGLCTMFLITGCTDTLDDVTYPYPDSKDVTMTLEEYNKLENGMTEQEVWDIIGGQCSNTGETGEKGTIYYTVSYGCNGSGTTGANALIMFQGGTLNTKSQHGLK